MNECNKQTAELLEDVLRFRQCTFEMVRLVPRERVQQQTAELIEDVLRFRQCTFEMVPRERVQQRIDKQMVLVIPGQSSTGSFVINGMLPRIHCLKAQKKQKQKWSCLFHCLFLCVFVCVHCDADREAQCAFYGLSSCVETSHKNACSGSTRKWWRWQFYIVGAPVQPGDATDALRSQIWSTSRELSSTCSPGRKWA